MNRSQMQMAAPRMTPVVRVLLIISAAVFLAQLALETGAGIQLSNILGFVPARLLNGWIWQLVTYAFLHSGLFHLLFNLLVIWTVGAELEGLWGAKTFSAYCLVATLGGAITYGVFSLVGLGGGPYVPMVGSSGVVYGLLLAYGILFGERTMYFFMLFPMPAKYFVLLLGAIELISSVFYSRDGVAHTAHLGGFVFGFLFLMAMAQWRQRAKRQNEGGGGRERKKRLKKSNHLRLIHGEDEDEPKTWN
ncbi:MAG: rhomboid family intramembrane serine protease [Bdellovibrionota bacterium]